MRLVLAILATMFAFSAFANTEEVTVKTTGMTCGACVDKMKNEITKIQGDLKGVTVTVKFNQAIIKVDDPSLKPEQVAEVVKKVEAAAVKAGLQVVPATPAKKSA